MSAYDNDRRVERVSEYHYSVEVAGDDHDVSASTSAGKWHAAPSIGSRSMHAANLRTRDEAEAWVASHTYGPFRTADEAIHHLIGDPQ